MKLYLISCGIEFFLLTLEDIRWNNNFFIFVCFLSGKGIQKIIMEKVDGVITIQAITQTPMIMEVRCQKEL